MAEDREQQSPNEIQEKREKQRGSIVGPRRALTTALLVAASALGISQVLPNDNNSTETTPNHPSASEVLKERQDAFEKILEDHPEAQVNSGGELELKFITDGNFLYPRIRYSTELYNGENTNQILGIRDFKQINGNQFETSTSTYVIENYITVKGTDADNRTNPLPDGSWIALIFTGADGKNTIGYLSQSRQTSEYWDIKESGSQTSLDLFTPSQYSDINKTTLISGK